MNTKIKYLVLVVFLFSIPVFVKDQFYLHLFIMVLFNSILALSLSVIMTTGQLSIGHAAFMGMGAYTVAILTTRLNLSFWIAFPLAGVVAAILAILIGRLTLRIKGAYFAIITFAFGEIVRLIWVNWVGLFGGVSGITNVPQINPIPIPGLFTIEFNNKGIFYVLTLLVAILTVWVIHRMRVSQFGRIFHSISEADQLTECLGVNIMNYKILAFATGCFFAGLVGGLFAPYLRFINPSSFTFVQSVEFIIYVALGGTATVAGPILGAIFLTALPEILRFSQDYQMIIYALALLTTLFLMPEGMVGLKAQISAWRASRTSLEEIKELKDGFTASKESL